MFTAHGAKRQITQDEAAQAAADLGLLLSSCRTPDDVKGAFRVQLRAVHPDTGGPVQDSSERIRVLGTARDTLNAWLEGQPKPDCKECRGTGYVWSKMAVKPCSRCG